MWSGSVAGKTTWCSVNFHGIRQCQTNLFKQEITLSHLQSILFHCIFFFMSLQTWDESQCGGAELCKKSSAEMPGLLVKAVSVTMKTQQQVQTENETWIRQERTSCSLNVYYFDHRRTKLQYLQGHTLFCVSEEAWFRNIILTLERRYTTPSWQTLMWVPF